MAAAVKPRPYRRILTSTLHRRFVHASAFSLLVCYIISFLIGVKTSLFWSWFPLGSCGVRTALLFISSLCVFVLRVGQLHIGARTTESKIQTWRQAFLSFDTIQTFGWYIFSSWWFSEVYRWSSPEDAELNWVKPGRHNERAQLNERPIYLHSFYFMLAVVQSFQHLYFDRDELGVPVARRTPQTTDRRTHPIEPLPVRINKTAPKILKRAVIISAITAVAGPIVYMVLLRSAAWGWTLYFAKIFWNFPRSAATPPNILLLLRLSLFYRSVFSGALLLVLWETSNFLFSAFLSQGPLTKGQPLTNGAKDPNGSLLNGLKAKKETVFTFAFWELCLISQEYPDRRKEIFKDIDREGGTAWTQIMKTSEGIIKGITSRINEFQNPQPTASKEPEPAKAPTTNTETTTSSAIQTLPRLTPAPKEEQIFLSSPKPNTNTQKFEAAFGSFARSYGGAHDWTPAAQAKTRSVVSRATSALLSPERKRQFSSSTHDIKLLTGYATPSANASSTASEISSPLVQYIMRSRFGAPFRQSYSNRLKKIVLGSPHTSLAPIVDATESLTRLLIASLAEDQFGKVQADVPAVVRLFTETIMALESFNGESGLQPHWTDVDFPKSNSADARRVEEVDIVVGALKNGLAELLASFKLYLREVGIVGRDLRLAREAAGGPLLA